MTKNKNTILKKMSHDSKKSHLNSLKSGFNDEKILLNNKDEASKLGSVTLNGKYYIAYVTYRSLDLRIAMATDSFDNVKPHIVYMRDNNMITSSEIINQLSERLVKKYSEKVLDEKIENHFKSILVGGVVNSIADPYKKQMEEDKKK